MKTTTEAVETFRQRLELSPTEAEDAQRRHKNVRNEIKAVFDVEGDFLTGSYARHTKTKPLKDVDIFFPLVGDSKKKWRDKGAQCNPRRVRGLPRQGLWQGRRRAWAPLRHCHLRQEEPYCHRGREGVVDRRGPRHRIERLLRDRRRPPGQMDQEQPRGARDGVDRQEQVPRLQVGSPRQDVEGVEPPGRKAHRAILPC